MPEKVKCGMEQFCHLEFIWTLGILSSLTNLCTFFSVWTPQEAAGDSMKGFGWSTRQPSTDVGFVTVRGPQTVSHQSQAYFLDHLGSVLLIFLEKIPVPFEWDNNATAYVFFGAEFK